MFHRFCICIPLLAQLTQAISSTCNAKIYGKPDVKDCFHLYNQLPSETLSPEVDAYTPRSFVEPKFLDPPFTPVPNPYRSQMVQLPKIWRQRTLSDGLPDVCWEILTIFQGPVVVR